MRWLVPLLLLAGCTAYANGTYTNVDTISLEQSRYLGKDALPPRGSPARFTEAQNCGTPDQWKSCLRVLRPSVRVIVDVASTSEPVPGTADPMPRPIVKQAEMPEGH